MRSRHADGLGLQLAPRSLMCSHVCIGPAGVRSNGIFVSNTFHGAVTGPSRHFSIVRYFSRLVLGDPRILNSRF